MFERENLMGAMQIGEFTNGYKITIRKAGAECSVQTDLQSYCHLQF